MKINLQIIDAHFVHGTTEIDDLNTKALVPKMVTRRRLTRSAKIVIYLADKISYSNERILFGTAFGELPATASILNSINEKTMISPTHFQNSVYNTSVSYLSMLSGNDKELMTISNGDKTGRDLLKMAAVKAMDGDEIVIFCAETLNIDKIDEVNTCIDSLECGLGLKVKYTQDSADISINNENSLNLPASCSELYNIVNEFQKNNKSIIEIEL